MIKIHRQLPGIQWPIPYMSRHPFAQYNITAAAWSALPHRYLVLLSDILSNTAVRRRFCNVPTTFQQRNNTLTAIQPSSGRPIEQTAFFSGFFQGRPTHDSKQNLCLPKICYGLCKLNK